MSAPTMAAHYHATAGPSRYQAPLPPPPTGPLASSRTDPSTPSGAWSPLSPRSQNHGAAPIQPNMSLPQPQLPQLPQPQPRPHQYAQEQHQSQSQQQPQHVEQPDSPSHRNPLTDLMDTEKVYVEQLTFVIRRVAAAWSRRDLPPPKLDAMFRAVEAVYRANRSFGSRLKEIGTNPDSSPKALGDLLMRWVDDLEPAYGRYATVFMTGFDNYAPVAKNSTLPSILVDVTAKSPPTPPLEQWTLDSLFLLPYHRLRYYRKLYARLLQNTTEGRSDHRLLLAANQKLEGLTRDVESRLELDVSEEESPPQSVAGSTGDQSRETSWANDKLRASQESSGRDSSIESQSVLSSFNSRGDSGRSSAATSVTQSPGREFSSPSSQRSSITDLELRIDTERTLDLFTMQPRKCKLQMSPPNLPYTRELRSSHDGVVDFIPTCTGQPVSHRRAHIIVLTDLFLITDRMEASEKASKAQEVARVQPGRVGEGGPMPEMWLAYPPLAGKHLQVMEGEQSNVLAVTVMRKETFVIHCESEIERDKMLKSISDCIEFASGRPPRPVVQIPPLPSQTGSPTDRGGARTPASSSQHSYFPTAPSSSSHGDNYAPAQAGSIAGQMRKMSLEPGQTMPGQTMPGQTMNWPSPQLPSGSQAQGGPQATATRPTRGASLTKGAPPTAGASGQYPGLGVTSPVSSEGGFAAFSGPRNLSMRSNGSDRSYSGGHPNQPTPMAFPQHPQHGYAPQPFGHQQMPGPPRQYQQDMRQMPDRRHDDLPPVPQIRGGENDNFSDSGAPSPTLMAPGAMPRARSTEPYHRTDTFHSTVSTQSAFSTQSMPAPVEQIQTPSELFGALKSNSAPPTAVEDEEDEVPEQPATLTGPAVITAQMKCKVFLQQGHGQWKSLGHGKLKLYVEKGRNVKQLVVESDKRKSSVLISTIVLTDGIERVARTGVAVEISDHGHRTGIIYMIQLRNEASAGGLYESLVAGSDRSRR